MMLMLAAVVFIWLVAIAYVRPVWIAGLALGMFAYESIFGNMTGINLAGIALYPRDLAFAAMAAAAFARAMLEPSKGRANAPWLVLALLALFSFVRGIQASGANVAGNDFREMFYLLAGVVFFATLRRDARCVRNLVDLWIGFGVILLMGGLLRVMGVGLGAAAEQELLSGGRALYAAPTFLILQAALMAFFAEQYRSRWARVPGLPWLLLSGVVIFQHRTVWITTTVCLAAMWTVLRPGRERSGSLVGRRLGAIVIAAGLVVLLIGGGKLETLQSQLAQSTESATAKHSTFAWRLEGWRYLLKEQQADASELVVGIPYGSGYRRVVFGSVENVAPHSWYVQTITRVGIVGTVLLLVGLGGLFRRGRPAGLLPRNLGALLVLSAALFGITYQPPQTQGILLGVVALSWGAKAEAGSRNEGDPVWGEVSTARAV